MPNALDAEQLPIRIPPGGTAETGKDVPTGLSARLMALARLIQIGSARGGRNGFGKKMLSDAEDVVARAGDRMRLSSGHTVVALAGGTGSGKSSLFNRVAGADFSTVGVTRPVTMDAHACIWGEAGSGALLEWLGVPKRSRFTRASALDAGEDDLAGLVLLDLPDHDSVVNHATGLVDRLVSMADVLVWVLDPQKYADAAVHRRFLVPLADHSDVIVVVLNQSDLLDSGQIDDCMTDLRRLLDSEQLHDVPILVTSALTGSGLDGLRKVLVEAVAARRAITDRIADDVDTVVTGFKPFAGNLSVPVPVVDAAMTGELVDRFAQAAGVDAVGDSLCSARELRAADLVGWPIAWLAQLITGRSPLRKVRLGQLWAELRAVASGPAGAQQAEIDNALSDFGDKLAHGLPAPWSQTVRTASRARAEEIPPALGGAIVESLPPAESVPAWWWLAGLLQGLAVGVFGVALVWMILILIFGVFKAGGPSAPAWTMDVWRLPWIAGAAVLSLAAGALIASVSMRRVRKNAAAEVSKVLAAIRGHITGVAQEMAVIPAEQELSELSRFREELTVATRDHAPARAQSSARV